MIIKILGIIGLIELCIAYVYVLYKLLEKEI